MYFSSFTQDLREQMQAQHFSTKSEYFQWNSLEFVGHCTSGNPITISRLATTAGDQRRPPLALLAEGILLMIPNEYAATISYIADELTHIFTE
jgi:L-fucose isomerase-like protein